LSKQGLAKKAEKVNLFFYSSELKQEKGELVDIQHVLSQPLWLNPLLKIGGNMCMNIICCENGVFFVNDLISENKKISQQPENYENRNDPDLVQAFLKKWWVESDFTVPNLPLSLRFKGSFFVLFVKNRPKHK
jgi:hypothetical protein